MSSKKSNGDTPVGDPPKEDEFEGMSGAKSDKFEQDFDPSDMGVGIGRSAEAETFEDFSKNLSPFEETPEEEEEIPKVPEPKVKSDAWFEEPTYKDQLVKYPDHCTFRGPKFKVFDLSNERDEARLDEFMEGTRPEEAPKVILNEIKKEFGKKSENWKILVTYHTILYRKLLSTGEDED